MDTCVRDQKVFRTEKNMEMELANTNNNLDNTTNSQEEVSLFFVKQSINTAPSTISRIATLEQEILNYSNEETVLGKQLLLVRYRKGKAVSELQETVIPDGYWKDWLSWKLFEEVSFNSLSKDKAKELETKAQQLNNYKALYYAIDAAIAYRENQGETLTVEEFIDKYPDVPSQVWYSLGRSSLRGNNELYGLVFDYVEIGERITAKTIQQAKKIIQGDGSPEYKKKLLDSTFKGKPLTIEIAIAPEPVVKPNLAVETQPVVNDVIEVSANEVQETNQEQTGVLIPSTTSAAQIFFSPTQTEDTEDTEEVTEDVASNEQPGTTLNQPRQLNKDEEIAALNAALEKAMNKVQSQKQKIAELEFDLASQKEEVKQLKVELFEAREQIKAYNEISESQESEEVDEVLEEILEIEDQEEQYKLLLKQVESNLTPFTRVEQIADFLDVAYSEKTTPAKLRSRLKKEINSALDMLKAE